MANILFSDLDGTLIEKGDPTSIKNFELMKEMQKQGHLIALCTGRNHIDIQPVLNNMAIPYDYLVLCNGSYIEDNKGNILFEEHIDKKVGEQVIRHALKQPDIVAAFCYDEGCPLIQDGQTKVLGLNGLEDTDEDFYSLLDKAEHFYMLSMHHIGLSVEIIKALADEISEAYPEIETHLNQQYVDVAPRGHSKGTGVKRLISLLDNIEKTYAIGDSFNDLPMIEAADVGATFTYALPEIQKEADKVVEYVYQLIEEEILS